jgi:hypothetical protein
VTAEPKWLDEAIEIGARARSNWERPDLDWEHLPEHQRDAWLVDVGGTIRNALPVIREGLAKEIEAARRAVASGAKDDLEVGTAIGIQQAANMIREG